MQARLESRDRWLAVAAAALLASCGDTLVDHDGGDLLLTPGGSQCGTGQVACLVGGASTCVAEDADHCGAQCAVCGAAPANASRRCVGGGCSFECDPGWLKCGGGCCRATAVAAGQAHACAITSQGTVKCWGAGDRGQLGNGGTSDSAVPVDVSGIAGGATAVAAGSAHTCALVGGAAFCWGDDTTGQLGDGTVSTAPRTTPVQVAGLSGATVLAVGGGRTTGPVPAYFGHGCAVAGGALRCWGANGSGQIGDGSTTPRPSPVQVLASGTTSVAAGEQHTCAVAAGAVRCWGANGSGQLGTGNTTPLSSPGAAAIGSGAAVVAAGQGHSCAITGTAGSEVFWCWGRNDEGQVNAGDTAPAAQLTPLQPPLGGGFNPLAASAGRAHSCGLKAGANGMKCFGANGQSQLSGPAAVTGKVDVALAAAAGVAAGGDHTCALLADGAVQCWGANDRGQAGTGAAGAPVVNPAFVSGR